MKRRRSTTVENPFVKPENKRWRLSPLSTLRQSVSPPPTTRRPSRANPGPRAPSAPTAPATTTAAVEAGEVEIADHVAFFAAKLGAVIRPAVPGQPRVSHPRWLDLYHRNLHERGRHFVIHQHDHPIAGTHYDLRLQCNATSSISFAIMYGLPGDPNSRRLNRNATETRVHNLWNHLIETASPDTGTMLLWDTGEYTVLPDHVRPRPADTSDSGADDGAPGDGDDAEPVKLHRAFQARKITLRLHGTRLPANYTLRLRLTHENNRVTQPKAPAYKRRRRNPPTTSEQQSTRRHTPVRVETSPSSASSPDARSTGSSWEDTFDVGPGPPRLAREVSSLLRTASPPRVRRTTHRAAVSVQMTPSTPSVASDKLTAVSSASSTKDDQDVQTRLSNAYPGATNSINSIHQRRWFLSLDRAASGFRPVVASSGHKVWERRSEHEGFPPFHVRGRDVETSVLTGRKSAEVAHDEGLVGYRPRGGWTPILE